MAVVTPASSIASSADSAPSATEWVARYATGLRYADLPDEVVAAAKRSILDWVADAIAGSREPVAEIVWRFLDASGASAATGAASVLGRAAKAPPPMAALANGTIGHALDFDDTHLAARLHTTAATLPAVLAVAEVEGLGGEEVIAAYVAGFESAVALSLAANPGHYEAGWHTTGTFGTLSAAIGAGRALRLDDERMGWAIGLAATQASGIQRVFGSMAKPFNAGRAASAGCTAALLAREGMTAPSDVLDGPRGLLELLSAPDRPAGWVATLGAREPAILDNSLKLFACCHALHAAVGATLRARERIGGDWGTVEAVEVVGWPVLPNIAAIREPKVAYEGKFSIYHAIATALIEGDAGTAQFTDEKVRDERIRGLAARVTFTAEPAYQIDDALVTIRLRSGRTESERAEGIPGRAGSEAVGAPALRKFHDLVAPSLDRSAAERLVEKVQRMETLERVGALWSPEVPERQQ